MSNWFEYKTEKNSYGSVEWWYFINLSTGEKRKLSSWGTLLKQVTKTETKDGWAEVTDMEASDSDTKTKVNSKASKSDNLTEQENSNDKEGKK